MEPTVTRRILRATAAALTVATAGLLAGGVPADAAVKKKATTTKAPKGPVANAACSPLGQTARTAAGARFDCVHVGAKLQWQPRGSRLNPLGWGETALVVTEYAKWNITVTSVENDVTAAVLAPDARNVPPRAGAQYVGLHLHLTYVGDNAQEMVRQGVNMKAIVAGQKEGVDRATPGTATQDDCWVNETTQKNASKDCMMPFEVDTAQLPSLVFYAAKVVGTPVVYFSAQPPKA